MNTATSSVSVPQTQNTAPVLEFRCLWTQDIRRKQKRWQDGKLKFHTFNKRVMVYDERSNFVGDTHWKDDEFNEGEEFELERGGIMVEVGDCIGKKDQDLYELVDKRVKDREERVAAKNAQSPARPQTSTPGNLLGPKTLNAVIGTPTGHYGRAMISNLSPFEQKQHVNQDENAERPSKRRKENDPPPKSGYAQNLMGATLTLVSKRPPSTANIRYEPLRASVQRLEANTIDLTKDEDGEDGVQSGRPGKRNPPRIQKRKSRRSPPSKSGYASSLTGAPLNLNRPGDIASKSKGLGVGSIGAIPGSMREEKTVSSSGPGEDLGNRPILRSRSPTPPTQEKVPARPKPRPICTSSPPPLPRQKEKTPRKPHHHPPRSNSPPPLPQEKEKATIESKPPPSNSDSSENNSFARVMADRPVTTLRIKSRAPRKMMMLMDLPSSRSPASTNAFGGSKKQAPRAQGHELPWMTNPTDSKHQKIEDQASINLDDLSSSPFDSGIDHQTIDDLLSRRELPSGPEKSSTKLQLPPRAHNYPMEPISNESNTPSHVKVSPSAEAIQSPLETPTIPPKVEHLTASPPIESDVKDIPQLVSPEIRGQSVKTLEESVPGQDIQPVLETQRPILQSIVEQSETPLAISNERKDVPKLVNPATRGQSVQVLASKTLDIVSADSWSMLPPAARGLSRPGKAVPENRFGKAAQVDEPVGDIGPWSRESFDLFGTWRPPGRGNVITG